MVIGFILIRGEAILVHRWLLGSRNLKKLVHLCMQGMALTFGFGVWKKFHGQDGIVANLWSLHSWMGLILVDRFHELLAQKGMRTTRVRVLPWHVFLGLYTYGLIVATTEIGLLEKLTFLQTERNVLKHCIKSMVVNGVGAGLALLSRLVILAAVSPKYQTL